MCYNDDDRQNSITTPKRIRKILKFNSIVHHVISTANLMRRQQPITSDFPNNLINFLCHPILSNLTQYYVQFNLK